jgi:hypothetical protein
MAVASSSLHEAPGREDIASCPWASKAKIHSVIPSRASSGFIGGFGELPGFGLQVLLCDDQELFIFAETVGHHEIPLALGAIAAFAPS